VSPATTRRCAAAALSLAIIAPPSSADVTPGDRITGENVARAKDLISPGLEWCYFNQGERSGTVPEWFSVAAMVNAGH